MYSDLHSALKAWRHGPPSPLSIQLLLTCFPTNKTCALHSLPVACIFSSRTERTEEPGIKEVPSQCFWTGLPGLAGLPGSPFLVLSCISKSRSGIELIPRAHHAGALLLNYISAPQLSTFRRFPTGFIVLESSSREEKISQTYHHLAE